MNIAIGSAFRNSAGYVERYERQVTRLMTERPSDGFRLLLEEGDSTDDTAEKLKAMFGDAVVSKNYNVPFYGSVNNVDRWRHLSRVWEGILTRIDKHDDVFIYVESDLIWHPEDMDKLINQLGKDVDLICPLVMKDGRHYDTWGMRGEDGEQFGALPPFHRSIQQRGILNPIPITGFGNCAVMKAEVARSCHFTPPELMTVGFCKDAIARGYTTFVDPKILIRHP